MILKHKLILSAALSALLLTGCGTTVERISPEEVTDLSGEWNDTDSRLVSEEMVGDMLARPWITDFVRVERHPPAVIVGEIRNLSHEHISVGTFVSDIERALINSGRVDFVASSGERGQIREERRDQDLNAREDTRNPMGQELGADFMMIGTINTIVDVEGREQVTYYQVDLNLVSLADNRKTWVGQKKIKKLIERSKYRP
ncbi:MAG: penicillin-binding protein activator LpoB [Gammaproteobacteria bacterium]|nr:penicillin-binding protein activator LpoB [Gammaproteobacteria bacterium]